MDMKTLVAVPCMDWVYTDFMQALLRLQGLEGADFAATKNTLIYNARNTIARNAVEKGYDRVMWFDSDVLMPPGAMAQLAADMDTGLDFVTGVYFQRKLPTKPVVYSDVWWRVNQGEAEAGATHIEGIPGGVFEVGGCGFGCCMTSGKMLKDLVDRVGAPFTPLIGVSEDLTFCLRAQQAGYKIYCDGRVKCGHIGSIVYDEQMFAPNCTS